MCAQTNKDITCPTQTSKQMRLFIVTFLWYRKLIKPCIWKFIIPRIIIAVMSGQPTKTKVPQIMTQSRFLHKSKLTIVSRIWSVLQTKLTITKTLHSRIKNLETSSACDATNWWQSNFKMPSTVFNDGKLIIRQFKETNWSITCTSARTHTEAKAVDRLVVVGPQTEIADRHIVPQCDLVTWGIAVPSVEDLDVMVSRGELVVSWQTVMPKLVDNLCLLSVSKCDAKVQVPSELVPKSQSRRVAIRVN